MEKKKSYKILMIDEYQNEIVADTDTATLASTLVWKEEHKRKTHLKSLNKSLTNFYGEKIMVFQDILKKASLELNFEELRLFNYLMGVCDFENWINISQKELADTLGTQQSNISRAIKGIKEKGFIETIKKSNSNYYRINPESAWKGSFETWKKVIDIKRFGK